MEIPVWFKQAYIQKPLKVNILILPIPSELVHMADPDGRINTKPNGQIIDQTAKLFKNRTAEFDHWFTIVLTPYIKV